MHRVFCVVAALFFCVAASLPCVAQDVIPVIRLSPNEAAKTKQVAQALIDTQKRNRRAQLAWNQFYQSYQAAHVDIEGLRFTEDGQFAVGRMNSPAVLLNEITVVELTPEERQKLKNLRRELTDSEEANKQAMKKWQDYQNQFLADHVGTATASDQTGEVLTVGGKHVPIPEPWNHGLAFTPDFRMAVPR
jgi:DNA repair ATPase RecN